ncbi:ribonuclease H-like domain-containing protein [Bacillus sp. H-16]|uniref:ribonuclease H-like domain-containing protein n=1 Tax=Alteribacter salitolerans TaxID=2912333 RepID=UPI0019655FDC|nr:ribonuclease H-like domain-containing protein [Alteribacter salitolerans]MBM7094360.1 ribonuclease H-like domain-containing protein [Alteribacter salitolerans]
MVRGKLQRLKGYINTETDSVQRIPKDGPDPEQEKTSSFPFSYEKKWYDFGFELHFYEGEYSLIRRKTYPVSSFHGSSAFSDLFHVHKQWQEEEEGHPLSLKGVDLEDLLFFDTETTGLSSGAGTTIFLMGYSRIKGDQVEIVQHFMPGPASEAAFFHGFLTDFSDTNQLVSYNGKAFDWPHLKSRHAFVRNEVPKLPLFGHYDLLHAARRLWKAELPSCRLSIVEEEKLNVKRVNETPGSLAPILYFEYLNHEDPEELLGIFKHHEWDVLSLIVLFSRISQRLLHMPHVQTTGREHLEMGKWFEQAKNSQQAEAHYVKALEYDGGIRQEAYVKLGHIYKKQKNPEKAREFFEKSLTGTGESKAAREAYEELAKLIEHQDKDYEKALAYTNLAIEAEKKISRLLRSHKPKTEGLLKRKTRLEIKIEKWGDSQ